jgi:hypothetical protein
MELATRLDTQTVWKEVRARAGLGRRSMRENERNPDRPRRIHLPHTLSPSPRFTSQVKSRGCHFMNSGFDVWPDVTLDLEGLDAMMKDPAFSKGTGTTCVFSFGCNPGIASHFVRHGLTAATGIEDVREAARAFGLRSISFNERDTQWPLPGSAGEKTFISTQLDVLYNTWSPGNYIVETAESTILYAGCPEEVKETSSAGPAVIGWIPSGPNIGFLAPHDETFTIQDWFDKPVPAVFVYEAPPTARAYIKGGRAQHSSKATTKLLNPKPYDIAPQGYDMLGALLFSDKPGQAPFWCGIQMDVAQALAIDGAGDVGPTPFQVCGGVWSALQYILEFPSAGDCFPEDVPSPFVMTRAFPWAGTLVARPAPEALEVPGLFDPGRADSLADILAGEAAPGRIEVRASPIGGNGTFAAADLALSTNLAQLAFEPFSILEGVTAGIGGPYNHSCSPNAYVDRNRAVRTSRAVKAGEEITLDYSLLSVAGAAGGEAATPFEGKCACGAAACRGTVGNASTLPKEYLLKTVKTQPILHDEALAALAK